MKSFGTSQLAGGWLASQLPGEPHAMARIFRFCGLTGSKYNHPADGRIPLISLQSFFQQLSIRISSAGISFQVLHVNVAWPMAGFRSDQTTLLKTQRCSPLLPTFLFIFIISHFYQYVSSLNCQASHMPWLGFSDPAA